MTSDIEIRKFINCRQAKSYIDQMFVIYRFLETFPRVGTDIFSTSIEVISSLTLKQTKLMIIKSMPLKKQTQMYSCLNDWRLCSIEFDFLEIFTRKHRWIPTVIAQSNIVTGKTTSQSGKILPIESCSLHQSKSSLFDKN